VIIKRHDEEFTPAQSGKRQAPAHRSSPDLTDALLELAIDQATPDLLLHWDEIFGGRGDPGIRGFLTQIDEAQTEVLIIPLGYEASIAAAWLIRAGFNRRVAAAFASEGHVLALPTAGRPTRRPEGDYDLHDRVMLNDSSEWDILMTSERPVKLKLVNNYSVLLVRDGAALDLDEHPYPPDLMRGASPLSTILGSML